jgi:hypothetical protein
VCERERERRGGGGEGVEMGNEDVYEVQRGGKEKRKEGKV